MDRIEPIHPGEILLEEFLEPMGISQYKLAKDIKVSQMRISEIINKKRGMSIDTSLRLSRYFGISVGFWTGIQLEYDTQIAKDKLEEKIKREVVPLSAA
jgi:addiction module HigA family antidote